MTADGQAVDTAPARSAGSNADEVEIHMADMVQDADKLLSNGNFDSASVRSDSLNVDAVDSRVANTVQEADIGQPSSALTSDSVSDLVDGCQPSFALSSASGTTLVDSCQPNDNHLPRIDNHFLSQVRLGKDSLGKVRLGESRSGEERIGQKKEREGVRNSLYGVIRDSDTGTMSADDGQGDGRGSLSRFFRISLSSSHSDIGEPLAVSC